MSLTERERKVLDLIVNYEDAESQVSDNYSNANIADLRAEFGKHETAGLLGSLEKKGFVWVEDELDAQDRFFDWSSNKTKSTSQIKKDGDQIVYGTEAGWEEYFK